MALLGGISVIHASMPVEDRHEEFVKTETFKAGFSYLVEQIYDLYRMESEATSKADLAMQARPGSYSDQSS